MRTNRPREIEAVVRSTAALLILCAVSLAAVGCPGVSGSEDGATPTLTPTVTPTITHTPTSVPTPMPTPTPISDPLVLEPISPELEGLRQRLETEIAAFTQRVGGSFAVAVTDLQTNESVHVNGDDIERIPGCTMNFFVLLSVVQDLQAGLYQEYEVGSFIARTIWASDPGTAHYLLRVTGRGDSYAGLWKINDLLRNQMGLKSALYDHPPAADAPTLIPGEWQANRITPLDFNRALTKLYRGELLGPGWNGYLLEKMTHVKPGLSHLLPAGVTDPTAMVSHKNGFIDYVPYYVDNDVGLVIFNRGGVQYAYVLTFWSQDNPWVLSDLVLGQTVSRLVWEHFSSVYK